MSRRAHLTFRIVALLTLFVAAVWPHRHAARSPLAARTAVTAAAHADEAPRARAELLAAVNDAER